jgi:anti-sigma B factor antagonist
VGRNVTHALEDGLGDNVPPNSGQLLKLSVQRYSDVGICVVVVGGALDLLTAPLLEQRVREQLAAAPAHLILDLESVGFLGCSGLSCLLLARELAEESSEWQLHLAGLINGAVARPLRLTGLISMFSTYPTLIHAVVDLLTPVAHSSPARERRRA